MKNDKMNKIIDEDIMFEIIDQQLNPDQMFQKYGISKEDFDLFVKKTFTYQKKIGHFLFRRNKLKIPKNPSTNGLF